MASKTQGAIERRATEIFTGTEEQFKAFIEAASRCFRCGVEKEMDFFNIYCDGCYHDDHMLEYNQRLSDFVWRVRFILRRSAVQKCVDRWVCFVRTKYEQRFEDWLVQKLTLRKIERKRCSVLSLARIAPRFEQRCARLYEQCSCELGRPGDQQAESDVNRAEARDVVLFDQAISEWDDADWDAISAVDREQTWVWLFTEGFISPNAASAHHVATMIDWDRDDPDFDIRDHRVFERRRGARAGVRVRRKKVEKTNGMCYVHLFPRKERIQKAEELGKFPTVAEVTASKTYVLPGRVLTLNDNVSHVEPRKGYPAWRQLQWMSHHCPERKIGGHVGYEEAFEEMDIAQLAESLAESPAMMRMLEAEAEADLSDPVTTLLREREGIEMCFEESKEPEIVVTCHEGPVYVGGEGDCWTKLPFIEWDVEDWQRASDFWQGKPAYPKPDRFNSPNFLWKTTEDLLKRRREYAMRGGLFAQIEYYIKWSVQEDGDLHIEDVMPCKLDGRTQKKPDGWDDGYNFWHEVKTRTTRIHILENPVRIVEGPVLVGKLGISAFDEACDRLNTPEVQRAAQALRTQQLSVANAEIESICPWSIPEHNRKYMDELALPWSVSSARPHPHPIHNAVRRNQLKRILPKYINTNVTIVSIGQSNLAMLQEGLENLGKDFDVTVQNPILDLKDFGRYLDNTQSVPDDPFRLETIHTPTAILFDSGHYITTGGLLKLAVMNPKVKVWLITSIYPLDSLVCDVPTRPTLADWRVDGDVMTYIPEGDVGGQYTQPADPGLLMTNRIVSKNGQHSWQGGIVDTKLNSHVQIWVPWHVAVPPLVALRVPEFMPVPRTRRSSPKNLGVIRVDDYVELVMYAMSLTNAKETDYWAKLRMKVERDGVYIRLSDRAWLVNSIHDAAQVLRVPELQSKFVSSFGEEIHYKTLGHLTRLWHRAFKTRYFKRSAAIVDNPNPLVTLPQAVARVNWINATCYELEWSMDVAQKSHWWHTVKYWGKRLFGVRTHDPLEEFDLDDVTGDLYLSRTLGLTKRNVRCYGLDHVRENQVATFWGAYDNGRARPVYRTDDGIEIADAEPEKWFKKLQELPDEIEREPTPPPAYIAETQQTSSEPLEILEVLERADAARWRPGITKAPEDEDPEVIVTRPHSLTFEPVPGPSRLNVGKAELKIDWQVCHACKRKRAIETAAGFGAFDMVPAHYFCSESCFESWRFLGTIDRMQSPGQLWITREAALAMTRGRQTREEEPDVSGSSVEEFEGAATTLGKIEYMAAKSAEAQLERERIGENTKRYFKQRMADRDTKGKRREYLHSSNEFVETVEIPAKHPSGIVPALTPEIIPKKEQRQLAKDYPEEWEKLMRKRPAAVGEINNFAGVKLWDVLWPKTVDHRYTNVPFKDVVSYPEISYPDQDCLLQAVEEAVGISRETLLFKALRTFPRSDLWNEQLSTRVLDVIGYAFGLSIRVRMPAQHVKWFGIDNGDLISLKFDGEHYTALKKRGGLMVMPVRERTTGAPPRFRELLAEINAIPSVKFKPWKPEGSRAKDLIRAFIANTTGLIGQLQTNQDKLKRWEDTIDAAMVNNHERQLCMIEGDPGCRKSSAIQKVLNKTKYKRDNLFSFVAATNVLAQDWKNKLGVMDKQKDTRKGTPASFVSTYETCLTQQYWGWIMIFDEDKYSKGLIALFALLFPWVTHFLFLCDEKQSARHEPNKDCHLNAPEILGEGAFYRDYSSCYLVGTWRFGPNIANFFRMPTFVHKRGGFYFTESDVLDWRSIKHLLGVDDEKAQHMFSQRAIFVAAHAAKMWSTELKGHDTDTFAGSQGLTAELAIVEVDNRVLAMSDPRIVYTVLTRAEYVILVCRFNTDHDALNLLEAHPIWRELMYYRNHFTPGHPVTIVAQHTIDMADILCKHREDRMLHGNPKRVKNLSFVEPYLDFDYKNRWIDPDDPVEKGGVRLNPESDLYRDQPFFRTHIIEYQHEPAQPAFRGTEIVRAEPRLLTHLPREDMQALLACDLSENRDRFARELTWRGLYTDQFPDTHLRRYDNAKVRKGLLSKAVGRNLREKNLNVNKLLASLPPDENPMFARPDYINWGQYQRASDRPSAKLGQYQRIFEASREMNEATFESQKTYGVALWKAWCHYMSWYPGERVAFSQTKWEAAQITFQERRAERSQALQKMSLNRADPDYHDFLTYKTQWKMKDLIPPNAKPLQPILVRSDEYVFTFGPVGVYLLDAIIADLPPWFYWHAKKSIDELTAFAATHMDCSEYEELDISALDTTVQGEAVVLMVELMSRYGIPQDLIDRYRRDKLDFKTRNLHFAIMTFSGEIFTWLTNSVKTVAKECLKFSIPPGFPMMNSGDDILRRAGLVESSLWELWGHVDKGVEKRSVGVRGSFCSFIVCKGLVLKDPILLFKRLMGWLSVGKADDIALGYFEMFSRNYLLSDRLYDVLNEREISHVMAVNDVMFHPKKYGFPTKLPWKKLDVSDFDKPSLNREQAVGLLETMAQMVMPTRMEESEIMPYASEELTFEY